MASTVAVMAMLIATCFQTTASLDAMTRVPTRCAAPESPEMVSGASTRTRLDGVPPAGEASRRLAKPAAAGRRTSTTAGSCAMPCTMAVTAVSW